MMYVAEAEKNRESVFNAFGEIKKKILLTAFVNNKREFISEIEDPKKKSTCMNLYKAARDINEEIHEKTEIHFLDSLIHNFSSICPTFKTSDKINHALDIYKKEMECAFEEFALLPKNLRFTFPFSASSLVGVSKEDYRKIRIKDFRFLNSFGNYLHVDYSWADDYIIYDNLQERMKNQEWTSRTHPEIKYSGWIADLIPLFHKRYGRDKAFLFERKFYESLPTFEYFKIEKIFGKERYCFHSPWISQIIRRFPEFSLVPYKTLYRETNGYSKDLNTLAWMYNFNNNIFSLERSIFEDFYE